MVLLILFINPDVAERNSVVFVDCVFRFSFKQNAFQKTRTAIVHTQHGGFITETQPLSISPGSGDVN